MSPVSRSAYDGYRVKALRQHLGIGQRAMATELDISVSYLSQIESGDRPLTGTVLAALAARYPGDWTAIDPSEHGALFAAVIDACSDPSVSDVAPSLQDIERIIRQHPLIARRLAALHATQQRNLAQLRALDDQIDANTGVSNRLPWEAVRDWFHVQQNYIDEIDREAERIAAEFAEGPPLRRFETRLRDRFGVTVEALVGDETVIRAFDGQSVLRVDPSQPAETTLFSVAHQLARLEFGDLIQSIAEAGMTSEVGRQLLGAGITNYAAGALLMPYQHFRQAARDCRHDVDRLRQRFGTSFEQTCHRLSTLQRPGALGIPVFFCRVDMAGNITKRHSATRLEFARFGGACPLWVVHEAVAIPDRILVQLAQTPDSVRYVSMAKGLVKPSNSFTRMPRRYAVALGCEERYAAEFTYADGLRTESAATPIGSSCRICPRADCDQRAFPPAASDLSINPNQRGRIPYQLGSPF
ncbi:Cro/Cl family transcriptional regulator [Sphingomonas glacialis]|uniref:Cro/Cl family transcriptional regulator n=1 Tax=Sphingomonas glacialis TaxID=658225 RepID=A0ABQ3LSG0_9SPHN|nr:short-chain fatty acyl-CoA regulator family protein [Sphingomonas glacialis]GHH24957.1 Cro/Cl family transcriptional regulator [Sphingomonas glacialis]